MKIRLENPVVNIPELTGGKNEKAIRGALHAKLRSFYCFIIHIQTSFLTIMMSRL